jgi:hypothetical protein
MLFSNNWIAYLPWTQCITSSLETRPSQLLRVPLVFLGRTIEQQGSQSVEISKGGIEKKVAEKPLHMMRLTVHQLQAW